MTDQNKGEEYLDLCGMEFIPENYGIANLAQSFLDVADVDCWHAGMDCTFFVYGYPTSLRNVDYDLPHIDVRQVVTSAKYRQSSHSEGVHQIEMTRISGFSSDGLSGGPVFHLSEDANGFYCGLAGIVVRGSETSDFLHFLEARLLLEFLQSV